MGFCFDVETLDVESTAVVLSAAIVYFDPKESISYQQLLDRTLFVKFNVEDQIKRLKRTISKSTLEWWAKQAKYVQDKSIKPSSSDLLVEDGVDRIVQYMNRYENPKEHTMWARGALDSLVIDSLCVSIDKEPITNYYTWRDVRTAIDIIYGSGNGYCEIEHSEFDKDRVLKHLPYHDVCLDVMMLLYGKEKHD